MTEDGVSTINQLIKIYLSSRSRGEWVHLSLESRDGKDFLNFCVKSPAGTPAGASGTWTPGSTPPCREKDASWNTFQKRRKTPSQLRRDQKRREAFFAKKQADIKVEISEKPERQQACSSPAEVKDEIELTEISDETASYEYKIGELLKIEGVYKNPKYKSWSEIDPSEEVKIMWEALKNESNVKGMEEIGEASATFEHSFEFWGTWKIKKPGITNKDVADSDNWANGIKIAEVKSA